MELIVTRADNSNYNLPSENSKIVSAVQTRTLMGEDTVAMTVQSVGYINFLIGDWIEVFGRKYTLNTLGEPQRIGENTFEYNLVFEGVNYELTKVVYRSADYSGFNPTSDFPLTGTAESFLTVLQYNLDRAFGQGVWAIGSFPATEAKTLSFTSENCLLALNRVCSEFGLEYEIKVIGGVKTINLGAVGDTLPLNLEYGKGKGLYSLTRTNVDSKNIVTRLYVEGSDRNVKAGYRDNALRLRIAANAESYIDSASAASFGIIEGSKIFGDIFPHREGTVSAINSSDLLEFTDSSMDFDLAETDTNGTKWLIAGQTAKIHFNTGALAGYEFELTAYNHTTKKFKIKPFKDERGLQFPNPDSAAFQIKTGDKYVILDIIMPDAYIQAAEAELLAMGQEYLSQNDQPRVEYSLDLDRFFLKSMFSGPGFDVNFLDAGDYLHIKDSKIGVDKEVRVKTFTRDVIDPWVYQVSLSDVIEPTRIELLLADTLETKKAARQSKLFDPARTRRNWRDVEEVAGMVDTLRAEVALIGSSEGQFQVDSFFEVNKGGNPDSFGATAGVLVHDTFEGDAGSVWNIGTFDVALSNSGAYYLYAQCSKANAGAVFTVSLTKIGVEDVPGYYHFPVGIISSVKDNSRTLTTVYGYTLVSGNNITTGIIQNDQSGIMINLQTGEIRGAFTFTNGQLIESVVNTKNSRYTQGTDPSASWTTLEEKQKHVNDIWAKILTDGIEEYVYTEVSVGVYEWVLNEAEIDGGRIKAGTIDAARIDVTGLFAEEINATNFNLEKGKIGAFEVDTILRSENSEGKGIYINPAEYEISIENKSEGFGVSSVNMKAGSLTPYLLLAGGTLGTYRTTVNSNELTTSLTSVQTRAPGGVDLPPIYMGRSTSAQGLTSVNVPTGGNRISLATDKKYSVDLRYLFNVYHSGGSANGETYKLQGSLKVSAVATLYGVTARGVTKVLGTKAAPIVTIERSDKRTGNDFYPITIKTAFSSQDCIYAYWKLDVNLQGDLTYQRYSNDWGWKYYWDTKTDWAIEYKHSMGALSSFYPSVGVTELTTSGFQTVWATNRYFRIDGEDSGAFIRSAGVWMHNNYEVATANDINTITADLTNYVLINDLQSAYYNKTESDNRFAQKVNYYDKATSDGRFAKLAGDGAQDFNVKNLIIHGQVNQWLAQQLVVEDARIQVNRRQDGATVDSGLVIYNKDTSSEVSSLVYDVNGIWKAGGETIASRPWVENSATAYNAARLGGYSAASYPRKAEAAYITGLWNIYRRGDGVQLLRFNTEREWHFAQSSTGATTGLSLVSEIDQKDFDIRHIGGNVVARFRAASGASTVWLVPDGGNVGIGGNLTAVNAALSGTLSVAQAATFAGNVGTSNFVSQMQGWRVTPQGQADFRHIFTGELQAKAFTADISQALVGSDVLTKSVAKLAQNWATTANGATSTIYVEELEGFPGFQVFAVGDRLLLRLFDRSGGGLLIKNIWATVATYVGTTKNVQRYTITVNSGGATGQTVYAGSMILDYGTPGSGVIERTVLDQQGSPYSRVSTWTDSPDNPANYTLHYQSGNLNSIANAEGWGVYSENSFLTGKLLVGDLTKAGQYMEYANGQLNIKGQITVTGGNAATKAEVDAGIAAAQSAAESYTDTLKNRVETTLGLAALEGINQTLITGGKVRTSLLEVTNIVAAGIRAGHVEGLTLNFDKGKIGGWSMGAVSIASENEFVRLHKTSGIVVSNTATTNNVFANNNRVNMYYSSPTDWGLIGRVGGNTIFQLGSTNQIAGINFDDSKLSTENWELNKDGSASFAGGLIKILADGDTTIGDVHVDAGGALVVKEGTDNRVLITKDDITTLAAIASSTQNTTVNNSIYTTFVFSNGSVNQPNAITVNNNGTRLTVTGTFGLQLRTEAGQRNSQATLSASVYLRKVGDGVGTGVLISSRSVTVNKLTGVPMSDVVNNISLNKVAVVSAGQYRIVADFYYRLSGPGPNEGSYYTAVLDINATSMHALYDGAFQRNEIGKNGIGVITNANNYSFFGKEGSTYKAVEKVSNAIMYDKPGVLFAGSIASAGGLTAGYWGAKYRAGSYREGNNIYRIHHNVGHLNYYVHLTPHSDARMWVISKTTTYVRVQASLASLSFDFAITGNNQ